MITGQYPDVMLAQLSSEVCEELMPVLAGNTESRVRKTLLNDSVQLEVIVFTHTIPQSRRPTTHHAHHHREERCWIDALATSFQNQLRYH